MTPRTQAAIHLVIQTIAGLALMSWGGLNAHWELHRNPRSVTLILVFIGILILGALVLPSIGAVLLAAAKGGIDVADPLLPHFGRREAAGEVSVAPKSAPTDVMPGEGHPS
jgi:hypothetical protein